MSFTILVNILLSEEDCKALHKEPAAGPPRVCNLNDFSRATWFFCLAGLAGKSTIENLTLFFFVFEIFFFLKHHGDM